MHYNLKVSLFALILVTTLPFFLLLTTLKAYTPYSVFYTLGSISGFIGAITLFWQFILGSRFISSRISNDTIWLNKLHKKMGIYGTVFVFAHPLIEAFNYGKGSLFLLAFNFDNTFNTYVSIGRLAFVLFLIIWVVSALVRGKIKYRPWLYIHYLAYPLMGLVFIHAFKIGTYLNSYDLLKNIWLTMSFIFALFVVYRLAKFFNFNKQKYTLIEKQKVGQDVYVYKLKANGKGIIPVVGQYCYLQFAKFGESHPFTVMEMDSKNNTLTFGIKAQGKFTNNLSKLKKGATIWIDGPYGVFTKEGHNELPKVIIAGGIGITPFVDLVKKYSNEDTYMFYANKFLNNAIRRDVFKEKLDNRYFDVLDAEDIKEENVIKGFLDKEKIQKCLPNKFFRKANFFICGSKPFYTNYKNLLISLGVAPKKIHYEEFGL